LKRKGDTSRNRSSEKEFGRAWLSIPERLVNLVGVLLLRLDSGGLGRLHAHTSILSKKTLGGIAFTGSNLGASGVGKTVRRTVVTVMLGIGATSDVITCVGSLTLALLILTRPFGSSRDPESSITRTLGPHSLRVKVAPSANGLIPE